MKHPHTLTIDEAIKFLQHAKKEIGGDAALILSLTSSGIPDANINNMYLYEDEDSAYVEVQCLHSYIVPKKVFLNGG